jgi:flagellar hook assembly protein FlgD
MDANGNESAPASVTLTTDAELDLPDRLNFVSVAPNPSRGRVNFVVDVPAVAGAVELTIYDLAGRRVRTVIHGPLPPGRHTFSWDGRTDAGRRLVSGIYVTRLSGAGQAVTRRATLVR